MATHQVKLFWQVGTTQKLLNNMWPFLAHGIRQHSCKVALLQQASFHIDVSMQAQQSKTHWAGLEDAALSCRQPQLGAPFQNVHGYACKPVVADTCCSSAHPAVCSRRMLLIVAQKSFHDTPAAVYYCRHYRGITTLCISSTAILNRYNDMKAHGCFSFGKDKKNTLCRRKC